jgi:hypothetical protein
LIATLGMEMTFSSQSYLSKALLKLFVLCRTILVTDDHTSDGAGSLLTTVDPAAHEAITILQITMSDTLPNTDYVTADLPPLSDKFTATIVTNTTHNQIPPADVNRCDHENVSHTAGNKMFERQNA